MSYTENSYEMSIIELFQQLGYQHVYGPDVVRDYTSPLYEDILKSQLKRLNPFTSEKILEGAFNKIKYFDNGDLVQRNEAFTNYLQNGIEVPFVENGESRTELVRIVDYSDLGNNSFIIANQWTFIENSEKRPDLIVFLNGIPVVLMELKSPSREETEVSEAYRQLRNYMQEIPSMFIYNAFCVMSDQLTSKAGTITAGEDRYMEWKTTDGSYENTKAAQFDTDRKSTRLNSSHTQKSRMPSSA